MGALGELLIPIVFFHDTYCLLMGALGELLIPIVFFHDTYCLLMVHLCFFRGNIGISTYIISVAPLSFPIVNLKTT